jgi:hypothetical protein
MDIVLHLLDSMANPTATDMRGNNTVCGVRVTEKQSWLLALSALNSHVSCVHFHVQESIARLRGHDDVALLLAEYVPSSVALAMTCEVFVDGSLPRHVLSCHAAVFETGCTST